jgi:hypothetical protein
MRVSMFVYRVFTDMGQAVGKSVEFKCIRKKKLANLADLNEWCDQNSLSHLGFDHGQTTTQSDWIMPPDNADSTIPRNTRTMYEVHYIITVRYIINVSDTLLYCLLYTDCYCSTYSVLTCMIYE